MGERKGKRLRGRGAEGDAGGDLDSDLVGVCFHGAHDCLHALPLHRPLRSSPTHGPHARCTVSARLSSRRADGSAAAGSYLGHRNGREGR